jgi:hypothetical protein
MARTGHPGSAVGKDRKFSCVGFSFVVYTDGGNTDIFMIFALSVFLPIRVYTFLQITLLHAHEK